MGQQQLLLLVLGIVIVGLAVVVGIQVFARSQKTANADALVNDAARLASDLQAWSLKPAVFGGGEGDFTGAAFNVLGFTTGGELAADDQHETENAVYTLTIDGPQEATLVGCNASLGNEVTTVVTGITPSDIATTISTDGC